MILAEDIKIKAIPIGTFDLSHAINKNIAVDALRHDAAQFAVQAIGRRWKKMGSKRHPAVRELLIAADGGGSNSSRCRLWKIALPSGKWNKIATAFDCPLCSREQPVSIIGHSAASVKGCLCFRATFREVGPG